MRAALTIAARNLRQRFRDRSAILFAVVIPFGLALAFTVLIPRDTTFSATYVVHDGDGGPIAAALVEDVLGALVQADVANVTIADGESSALAALDDGRTGAVILIPAGFSTAVTSGQPTTVRIVGLPEAPLATQIAKSVIGSFASEVGSIQLAIHAGAGWQPGQPVPALDPAAVDEIRGLASPIVVEDLPIERHQASSTTFYAAAMAIMFLFFASIFGPIGLLAERRTGTLARLLAAPISSGSIVLGAAITAFVLGIVSMTVLVVGTSALLGATWGPPLLVGALIVAAVVAASGMSMLICTLARTDEQAGGWNAMVSISLAVLGGSMIPLANAPELLRQLSRITPHAWFLAAIDSMSGASVGPSDVAPAVAVLLAFGLVTGAVGLARARNFLVAR
jgi:ABC-2 type transport system permease protein